MARQKGDGRGRLGGRVKGVPNKVSSGMRNVISQWTEDKFEEVFMENFNQIEDPRDRCEVYLKLLKFCLPTLSAVELEAKVEEMSFKDELKQMAQED